MALIPLYSISEPFSSLTHLMTAGFAIVGLFFLIRKGRGSGPRVFALVVFSFTLVFLFAMSGVFHWLEPGGVARGVLQRMDHAGIWALIAGTFTPIHLILFRGVSRWGILLLVWTLAIVGLVMQVIFFHSFPEALTLSFFLAMGWFGLFTVIAFVRSYGDPSIKYLAWGGIFYSVGAVIDHLGWPVVIPGVFQYHEIFHVFIILGAGFHWYFIYSWAAHPIGSEITFEVREYPSGDFVAKALGENFYLMADSKVDILRQIQLKVRHSYHEHWSPKVRLRYVQEEFIGLQTHGGLSDPLLENRREQAVHRQEFHNH